jgi:hypothetical protein
MIDTIANNGSVLFRSGLLTAGEVNDFNKWKLWTDFTPAEFKTYSDHWKLYPKDRYTVQLENKQHQPVIGQPVYLLDKRTNDTVWSAVTDNTGKAELWGAMKNDSTQSEYRIACQGITETITALPFAKGINSMELDQPCSVSNKVDIAVVVDATGSMTDEIDFLKVELEDVLRNTFAEYHDLDLHVSSVFYRDKNDEYLTRHIDFQTDLVRVLNFIKLQRASGGGDIPEAVHAALQTTLDSLQWSGTARSRILFLVTDAPPHDETKDKIFQLIRRAAASGVRIVPVICRGADKSTEFIMRSMALATNGTYVFLTDDNAAEFLTGKRTAGFFDVQFLNALLERIVKQMVEANDCSGQKERDIPKNIAANIENINVNISNNRIVTIESKNHLSDVFISDFTGKILSRLNTNENQNKWSFDCGSYPAGTFLVRYINASNEWGAEKFVITH